jgi:hypothetical protein
MLPIITVALLAWVFIATAQPQAPANEEKPTFYRLIPGTYVNGWPRFTIHYPKEWVERHSNPLRGAVFRVSLPGSVDLPTLVVLIATNPMPLDKLASFLVMVFRSTATDVTVVSDKPTQLRDGALAREVEITKVENNVSRSTLVLATKKGDLYTMTIVESLKGKMGEDLRAILYSLEFQPGKDEPVKVPSDVQEFLDKMGNDMVSHDVANVMTRYSDKYLNSGGKKGEIERFIRQTITSITSFEISITEFVTEGDRAYLAGFTKTNTGKWPLGSSSIIKESGEWKWYGNQRDVSP